MKNTSSTERGWRPTAKVVRRTLAVIGTVVVLAIAALVLFLDPLVNGVVKPRLVRALAVVVPQCDIHPGYVTVDILSNRIACDSLLVEARDTSWLARTGPLSVHGIDWWSLIWKEEITPEDLAAVVVEMREGRLILPRSASEVLYDSFRISVAESMIVVTSLTFLPLFDDDVLFASSPFRKTRLRVTVPRVEASGIAWLAPHEGPTLVARSVRLQDPVFDILINKEKPAVRDPIPPMMPSHLLLAMGDDIRIDSLTVSNGQLLYGERYGPGWRPGVIEFDSVQLAVVRRAHTIEGSDTILLHAGGRFMRAGIMSVAMVVPVGQPGLSYTYSGALGRMELTSLNGFLERAEHVRITSGVLYDATFTIAVRAGRARGSVRALYRDLTIAMIDARTGSAAGILDRIATMVGNRITIRGTNMPDDAGKATIGTVRYDRRGDEAFIEYSWFALRSGVGDVAGF